MLFETILIQGIQFAREFFRLCFIFNPPRPASSFLPDRNLSRVESADFRFLNDTNTSTLKHHSCVLAPLRECLRARRFRASLLLHLHLCAVCVCMCVYVYVYVCVCMCVCVCACVCAHTHTYTHIHIHTRSHSFFSLRASCVDSKPQKKRSVWPQNSSEVSTAQ